MELLELIRAAVSAVWDFLVRTQLLGVFIGFGVVEIWKHWGEKGERAALLYLFSLESVHLFERFVQYCGQIMPEGGRPGISRSIPYEMMPATSISRMVELGVDTHVMRSIHQIRQLNAQVTLQCHRANDILVQERIEKTRNAHQAGLLNRGPGFSLVDFVTPLSHETFRSIFRFVADEIRDTKNAIEILLQAAERANDKDRLYLQRRLFEEQRVKFDEIVKKDKLRQEDIKRRQDEHDAQEEAGRKGYQARNQAEANTAGQSAQETK